MVAREQRFLSGVVSTVSFKRFGAFVPLVTLLALSVPAWIVLLDPTVNVWREYDGANHMVRAYLLSRAWDRGEWFPRWSPEQYGGYGYPTLNFYAPLVYFLVAALGRVIPTDTGIYDAYLLVSVGSALLLFAGTYALGYAVTRHKPVAVLTACLVAYGPYALIPNLYIFGSVPHVAGLGLMAWLLVALHEGWAPSDATWWRRGWWWVTATIVALLMVTHGVSAVLSVVIGGGWLVALLVRRPDLLAFARVMAAGVVGAALSAFFWLPSILDAHLVQTERLQLGALNFRNWFTIWPGYHPQLWGEQWRSGFVTGIPIDIHLGYPHTSTGPSRLGLWQALILVAAIAYLGRAWWMRGRAPSNVATVPVAFGLGMALFLRVQQFDWAIPLWERFTILQMIQMPSRMFGPLAFAVAIAFAGVAGTLVPREGWRAWMSVLVIGGAMSYFGTLDRGTFNDEVIDRRVDDRALDAIERLDPGNTASTNEFLPRTANVQTWLGDEARGFWLYDRTYPEAGWVAGQVMAWQGDIGVRQVWQGGLTWVADVRVGPTDGLASDLAFHQLHFPGWRAWVDGVPVDLRPAPVVAVQAFEPGFILVPVPEGEHRVTLRFGPDGPRAAGAAISVVGALVVAGLLGGVAVRSGLSLRVAIAPIIIGLVMSATIGGLATWRATRMPGGMFSWLDPVLAPRVVESVADAVLEGRARVESPTGAERGPGKYVDIKPLAVRAQDKPLRDAGIAFRRLLFMHPPAAVSVDIDVPVARNGERAYLQTAIAIDPEVWSASLGDGVRFTVVASARPRPNGPPLADVTPEVTIVDQVMNPRASGDQRRWVDILTSLDQWNGERVRLRFVTDPRQAPSNDWAGWAEPHVVLLDALEAGRMERGVVWEAKVALAG
jgi:hypothetical protein